MFPLFSCFESDPGRNNRGMNGSASGTSIPLLFQRSSSPPAADRNAFFPRNGQEKRETLWSAVPDIRAPDIRHFFPFLHLSLPCLPPSYSLRCFAPVLRRFFLRTHFNLKTRRCSEKQTAFSNGNNRDKDRYLASMHSSLILRSTLHESSNYQRVFASQKILTRIQKVDRT